MAKIDNTQNLAGDLAHILGHTQGIWESLRGRRVFITGGTGFFGRWLLESFARANAELELGAETCLLTRNPAEFAAKAPHLAARQSGIQLMEGEFTSFPFPKGQFEWVIHAATGLEFSPTAEAPLGIYDDNVNGTRRVLEFTRQCGARRFLFTSSGAAYGRQPADLTHIPEDFAGAADTMDAGTIYGQSKRACEFMAAMYARRYGFAAPITRCFAFSGPFLPLDLNFAIGNFVRDALAGGPIRVGGDGTPRRSYLYGADLAIWLWTILIRGESCRIYNVGSGEDLSIAELARKVAAIAGRKSGSAIPVTIGKEAVAGTPVSRYVPSVERAKNELGLRSWISLDEGIERMYEWYHPFPEGPRNQAP